MSGTELTSYINDNDKILILYPQSFNSSSILSAIYLYFKLKNIDVTVFCKNKERLKQLIPDEFLVSYDDVGVSHDYVLIESLYEYENVGLNIKNKKLIFIETFGGLKNEWKDTFKLLKFKLCDLGSHIKYEVRGISDKINLLDSILNYILCNPTTCHYVFSTNKGNYDYIKDSFESTGIPLNDEDQIILSDNIQLICKGVSYLHITNVLEVRDMIKLISGIYSSMSSYEDILSFHVIIYVNSKDKELYEIFNKEYAKHSQIFNEFYDSATYIQSINDSLLI